MKFGSQDYRIVRTLAADCRTRRYEAVWREAECQLLTVTVVLSRTDEPAYRAWFRRITEVLAGLDHPGIPPCRETGVLDGFPFLIFPAEEGEDLASQIRQRGPVSAAEVVRIICASAAALDHAHERGIVHGDLHPKRVRLGPGGEVWVTGFGEYPPPEGLVGDVHHLAPEQLVYPENTCPQSDVYALAEIAYFLLTGDFAFGGGTADWSARKREVFVPCIRGHCPDVPPAVDSVLQRAMAADPRSRFRTASQLAWSLVLAMENDGRSVVAGSDRFGSWVGDWGRANTHRLQLLINSNTPQKEFEDAILNLDIFGSCFPSGDDYWAPLLAVLPRIAEVLFSPLFGESASTLLGRVGYPCLEVLRRVMVTVPEYPRNLLRAVALCGGIQDVVHVLGRHTDDWTRAYAASVLRELLSECSEQANEPFVLTALQNALDDPHGDVRRQAARAIILGLRYAWGTAAAQDDVKVLADLLSKIARDDIAWEELDCFGTATGIMLKALWLLLSSSTEQRSEVREMAATACRFLNHSDSRIIDALERCAKYDPSESVRAAAQQSLDRLRERGMR
jgi:serine/threonine protein kinase